ncbi:hypothetical protein H8356DRAFT_1342271 [Neocallimastix lanati (nom. inval.)]|nr:hypothetical protein H8356DRAFT_1342271 [Neocallimastix sp. JGI-2020a]
MLKLSVVKEENVCNFQMSNTSSDPSKGDGIKTNIFKCIMGDGRLCVKGKVPKSFIESNDNGGIIGTSVPHQGSASIFLYICNNDGCTKEGNAIKGTSAKTLIIECNGSKMLGVCTVKVINSHCISDSFFFFLLDSITYDAIWGITETTAGIYLYFFDPNNDRMDPSIQSLELFPMSRAYQYNELKVGTQVHEQHCKTSERKVSQRFLERVASFNVVNGIVKTKEKPEPAIRFILLKEILPLPTATSIFYISFFKIYDINTYYGKGKSHYYRSIAIDSYPKDTNKYIIKVYNEYNLYDIDQSVPNNIAISINGDDYNINLYDTLYDENGPAERFNGILIRYSWKLQTISFYSTKKFSNFIPNSEMRGTINDNSSVDNNTNIDINSKREPKDFDDIFYLPDKEE